jgi:adenylate cyclase class 2
MIEAELKARVRDPAAVRAALDERSTGQAATYRDVYYDRPDRSLSAAGHELRLRTVETASARRYLLTYKAPAVDAASQSKPEHETEVGNPDVLAVVLARLGMTELVSFTKQCVNYTFAAGGRRLLATLVTVPELDGTFLEVETQTTDADVSAALASIRALLGQLGISANELTTDTYSGAIRRVRTAGEHV